MHLRDRGALTVWLTPEAIAGSKLIQRAITSSRLYATCSRIVEISRERRLTISIYEERIQGRMEIEALNRRTKRLAPPS